MPIINGNVKTMEREQKLAAAAVEAYLHIVGNDLRVYIDSPANVATSKREIDSEYADDVETLVRVAEKAGKNSGKMIIISSLDDRLALKELEGRLTKTGIAVQKVGNSMIGFEVPDNFPAVMETITRNHLAQRAELAVAAANTALGNVLSDEFLHDLRHPELRAAGHSGIAARAFLI